MALSDLGEEDSLIAQKNLTIGELIDMFGREAVRRGLEYTRSLDDADETFREQADADRMTEGYRKAGVQGDIEPVSEKWEAEIEEGGLGLDDE